MHKGSLFLFKSQDTSVSATFKASESAQQKDKVEPFQLSSPCTSRPLAPHSEREEVGPGHWSWPPRLVQVRWSHTDKIFVRLPEMNLTPYCWLYFISSIFPMTLSRRFLLY